MTSEHSDYDCLLEGDICAHESARAYAVTPRSPQLAGHSHFGASVRSNRTHKTTPFGVGDYTGKGYHHGEMMVKLS